MTPNEQVVDYILHNGRNLSWHELALKFGCVSADSARMAWNKVKNDPSNISMFEPSSLAVAPPHRAFDGKARLNKEQYVINIEDKITRFEEDLTKGTAQVEALVGQEIKTLEELVDKCKIDLTKWEITKWVQNFWNNRYQVKAYLSPKQEKDKFQENFVEFLKTYKFEAPTQNPLESPCVSPVNLDKALHTEGEVKDWEVCAKEGTVLKPNGCLILNKQDFHFDKLDVYGDNDIKKRFNSFRASIHRILRKTKLSYNLSEVIYILGSDMFNCEWTGMTTKGTPQKNTIDYHSGFQMILDHEIQNIKDMLQYGPIVKVLYIPGNHDEYVGWHLVQALSAIFKDVPLVKFDIDPSYRKYYKFGNSAIMFSHGDVVKPQKLASIFPQEFKEHWSSCNYQYIFTGDKHHELTMDFDGILFYQLTQGSNATSQWDSKQGYQAKGFLTAFVISENYGIGDVLKERL